MDFNESKNTYRSFIEESIGFIGKDLDFFVARKAELLKNVIKQFLPKIIKPRILDVGCGHGFIHSHFHKNDYDVVGVDMALEVLELARQSNPQVLYVSHDGETLPFEPGTFDVAIAICVMHHVLPAKWNAFLLEMKRVVKAGGMVVIIEHNPYNPLTRYVVSKNILDKDAVLVTRPNLEKLMLQAGFKTANSRFTLFTPFTLSVFRWLDKMLWWCPLGAQYYTIARC